MTGRPPTGKLAAPPNVRAGAKAGSGERGGDMATENERDAARVCRAIEAICNRGDFAAADALFTPDYVNHGGLIPDLVRGPEALKVAVALYHAAFPDFHVTAEPLRWRASTVLLRWTAARRPGGAGGGVTGLTRGRLVGGRIAESWTHWDAARALEQLGMPRRGEREGR